MSLIEKPDTTGHSGLDLQSLDVTGLWEALARDCGAAMGLLHRNGTVLFFNRIASLLFLGVESEATPNRPLREMVGPAFAEERGRFMARVLESGEPLQVLSMVRGVLQYATYRPIDPARGLVLISAFPASLVAERPEMRPASGVEVAEHNDLGPLGVLTERELELLHHIGMGRSSDESAHMMHRSTRTVEWHRASLGEKLGCDNRVQLARIAQRCGLTAVDLPLLHDLHRGARRRAAQSH
jgi:DNA-binding CsgD family transcriptional regulator